jgi:eukaryotic-like serine/threonine-protein kinase
MGGTPPNADVWVIDVARNTTSRLTFTPTSEIRPVWSPDGTRIAFTTLGAGDTSLRVKAASGTRGDELLLSFPGTTGPVYAEDWASDNSFLVYSATTRGGNGLDLWILPLSGDRKPFPFVEAPTPQTQAAISPDRRWIAYTSDESGPSQVYVQPYPATGGRYQVSQNGGTQPRWRGDGKELYFLASDRTLMAVSVEAAREFQAGVPHPLFVTDLTSAAHRYAVTRDGAKFLAIAPAEQTATQSPLTVIVNWVASVQK